MQHAILSLVPHADLLLASAKVAGGVIQFFFDRWIDMSTIR
ncbi:hypothetical protein LV79_001228 [Actinokineospora globicatena]|nr:hypothetical protein [Actinokineospora globicatena]